MMSFSEACASLWKLAFVVAIVLWLTFTLTEARSEYRSECFTALKFFKLAFVK